MTISLSHISSQHCLFIEVFGDVFQHISLKFSPHSTSNWLSSELRLGLYNTLIPFFFSHSVAHVLGIILLLHDEISFNCQTDHI